MKKPNPLWCKVVRHYVDHKVVMIKDLPNSTEIIDKPDLARTWFLGNWSTDYRVIYKNAENKWVELTTEHIEGRGHFTKYLPWNGLAWDILRR